MCYSFSRILRDIKSCSVCITNKKGYNQSRVVLDDYNSLGTFSHRISFIAGCQTNSYPMLLRHKIVSKQQNCLENSKTREKCGGTPVFKIDEKLPSAEFPGTVRSDWRSRTWDLKPIEFFLCGNLKSKVNIKSQPLSPSSNSKFHGDMCVQTHRFQDMNPFLTRQETWKND